MTTPTDLSLQEKAAQMGGDLSYATGLFRLLSVPMAWSFHSAFPAGENKQRGIPPVLFTDGPRGIVFGQSTCFPVAAGRAASWDTELEERVGDALGVEARSMGANLFAGICINLHHHPAWGRCQESYGESSFLTGEMGAAVVHGVQRHVMACIKHFACNSIENTRFDVDVAVSDEVLHEVYLPHFHRCCATNEHPEGAVAVMSAYNRVNGTYCGHNAHLLRDVLKGEFGFTGFVMSDFIYGVHDTVAAAKGGMDLEMPIPRYFGSKLVEAVRRGEVDESVLDEAVGRLLPVKERFREGSQPDRYSAASVACEEHRKLARETAQKAIVLLQNEGDALPLDSASLKRIVVCGDLARAANAGDHGSSRVSPPYVVTPLQGIQEALRDTDAVVDWIGSRKTSKAAAAAAGADAAIVVVGCSHSDEGENIFWSGGDRASISLSGRDETLIAAVSGQCARCVVVLIGGSAFATERWRGSVPAIVMAWYGGMEGGRALADVIFGSVSPSGRLPVAFPSAESDLPALDTRSHAVTYTRFHGQEHLDRSGIEAAFPLGFGLAFGAAFTYAIDDIDIDDGTVTVRCAVTNTGDRDASTVAQLYLSSPALRDHPDKERPVRELKGFKRIDIGAQSSLSVTFSLDSSRDMRLRVDRKWVTPTGEYVAWVGGSAAERDLVKREFVLE